jgi:quercetin dioxygenase-like cupin family protein
MEITRNGTQPSVKGTDEWFTGDVRIDSQFQRSEPSRLTGAIVTFEPGARTAWHTHPLGQTRIVTSGTGWTQCEEEPRVEIHAGDVIWCPPEQLKSITIIKLINFTWLNFFYRVGIVA